MDGWMDVLSGQCSNNGWRCNRKRTVYCKVLFTSLHQPQGTWLPLGSTSKCRYLKERTTPPPYVWSANSPRALQILAGGTKKLTFSSKVVLIYIFIHSIVVRSPSSTSMVIKAFIGIVWCGRSIGRSFPYLLSAVLPRFARQRQIVKCHLITSHHHHQFGLLIVCFQALSDRSAKKAAGLICLPRLLLVTVSGTYSISMNLRVTDKFPYNPTVACHKSEPQTN